jgi:hypothetical protein
VAKRARTIWALCALASGAIPAHSDESVTLRQVTVGKEITEILRPFNGATGAPGAEFAGGPRFGEDRCLRGL